MLREEWESFDRVQKVKNSMKIKLGTQAGYQISPRPNIILPLVGSAPLKGTHNFSFSLGTLAAKSNLTN